jgi:hypothetical protein
MSMKIGYSLLLRELVRAEDVDYGDCEDFQIVCPACSEAVFKKARPRDDGSTSHFLSHHRIDPATTEICENRVASLSERFIAVSNAKQRGQTIAAFMDVLREALMASLEAVSGNDKLRQNTNRLMAKKYLWGIADAAVDVLRRFDGMKMLDKAVEDSIDNFPRYRDQTVFWRHEQGRFVGDTLRHLTTPQVRGNMRYLTALAVLNLNEHMDGLRARIQEDLANPDGLTRAQGKLFQQAAQMLQNMLRHDDGKLRAEERKLTGGTQTNVSNLRAIIATELFGPMVGILTGVEFMKLAKGQIEVLKPEDKLARFEEIFREMAAALGDKEMKPPTV